MAERHNGNEVTPAEIGYMPATVHDHTERSNGMTLHTIGDDERTDVEIYDGDREAHRRGNPPEDIQ